jgi:hypothetical protein
MDLIKLLKNMDNNLWRLRLLKSSEAYYKGEEEYKRFLEYHDRFCFLMNKIYRRSTAKNLNASDINVSNIIEWSSNQEIEEWIKFQMPAYENFYLFLKIQ